MYKYIKNVIVGTKNNINTFNCNSNAIIVNINIRL
jgi:hypothetical protein